MDKISNIAYGVVCLVVIVVLIATVAIPVIEDAQMDQRTAANNSDYIYRVVETDEVVVVKVVSTGVISVNGVSLNLSVGPWLIADDIYGTVTNQYVQIFDTEQSQFYVATGSTMTFSNGSYSVVDSSEVEVNSGTYEGDLKVVSSTGGNFICASMSNDHPIINADSFIGENVYRQLSDGENTAIATCVVTGSMKSGFTISSLRLNNEEITSDKITVDVTLNTTDNEDTSYTLNGMSVSISCTDSDNVVWTGTISGANVFVPIEYTYLTAENSMIIKLLSVIPLILLIIPVMLAANMITRRD